MAKSTKMKKIEKLKAKISEIDERVKNELEQKQMYIKEIETLEAESILDACKSSNLALEEAVESFALFNKIKENGYSMEDISNMIIPKERDQEPPTDKDGAEEKKGDTSNVSI